jgi:hypothetical protein
MTRGKKVLLGCAVIVAAGILALVVAFFMFTAWIRSPGELLASHRLIDSQTSLMAEIVLPRDHAAARALVRELLAAKRRRDLEQIETADLPAPVTWIMGQLPDQEPSDEEIDHILPILLATTLQGEAAEPSQVLFVASFPAIGKAPTILDFILRFTARRSASPDSDLGWAEHRGEDLYQFRGRLPVWVSILGSDVLLSGDERVVRSGLDVLARGETEQDPGAAMARLLALAPPDAVLRIASQGAPADRLLALLESAEPGVGRLLERMAGGSEQVWAWGRLAAEDRLECEIHAIGGGDAEAGDDSRFNLEFGRIHVSAEPLPAPRTGERAWSLRIDGVTALLEALPLHLARRLDLGRDEDAAAPPPNPPAD